MCDLGVASPPPALAAGGNDRASEDLLQLAGNPFANMLNGKCLYHSSWRNHHNELMLRLCIFAVLVLLMRYTEIDMQWRISPYIYLYNSVADPDPH